MKKYFITCFTLLMMVSHFSYAITLEQLQLQFAQYPVTRADFTQDRYIQGLSKPLHSTGKMIISKTLGLWWQQKTPFIMTLKMNDQRMEQQIANQAPQIITAQAQPQLFQFNSLLSAVFDADKNTLEQNFTLTLSQQDKQWQLILHPKAAPLNKIFTQIELSGTKYLSQIIIDDKQHDKTIITFTNHNTKPLTTDEKQLFQ
ncbi:LolA family protein [Orbus mooreae]|uniref:LolA family protein n=1 Tax=Orbus mooreae TaxID=3074107 RepID=UPI00370D8178